MKHTPGPWKIVEEGRSKTLWSAYTEVDHKYVFVDASMSEADARLISVAPEMHELLREVYNNDRVPRSSIGELLDKLDL